MSASVCLRRFLVGFPGLVGVVFLLSTPAQAGDTRFWNHFPLPYQNQTECAKKKGGCGTETTPTDQTISLLPPEGCQITYMEKDGVQVPQPLKIWNTDPLRRKPAYSVLAWDMKNPIRCLKGFIAVEDPTDPTGRTVKLGLGSFFARLDGFVNEPEGALHLVHANDVYDGTNAGLVIENKGNAGANANHKANKSGAVSATTFSLGPWKHVVAPLGTSPVTLVPESAFPGSGGRFVWGEHWFSRIALAYQHGFTSNLYDTNYLPLLSTKAGIAALSGTFGLWTSSGEVSECTGGLAQIYPGWCREWGPKVIVTNLGWMGFADPYPSAAAVNVNTMKSIDAPIHVQFGTQPGASALKLIVENIAASGAATGFTNNAGLNIRVNDPAAAGEVLFSLGKANDPRKNRGALQFDHAQGAFRFVTPGEGVVAPRLRISPYGRLAVGADVDPGLNALYIPAAAVGAGGFAIKTDGAISVAGTQYTSDLRLKKDVKPITGALEKVVQINGVTYSWKDEAKGKLREAGVIAQDVEKVLPEVVRKDAEGTLSVDYGKMSGLLIEAIKELKAQNAALKAEIEALKKK